LTTEWVVVVVISDLPFPTEDFLLSLEFDVLLYKIIMLIYQKEIVTLFKELL
jgi:hypothetical protein